MHIDLNQNLFFKRGLQIFVSIGIAILVFGINLEFIESYLYDARVRIMPPPPSTDQVRLILLDAQSIEALRGAPDFAGHAEFLRRLAVTHPSAVVYDFRLEEMTGSLQQKADFAAAAAEIPFFRIMTDSLVMKGEEGKLRAPPPLNRIQISSAPKSSDTKNFAKDGVTRRFLIEYQGQEMLHVELAKIDRPEIANIQNIRGHFEFLGTTQAYIHYRPNGSFKTYSFSNILNNEFDPKDFKNKIIIVGQDTQVSELDYAQTPYSREAIAMTSAEVHGNIVETLIRNDSPVRGPRWLDFLMTTLIAFIAVGALFRAKVTQGLMVLGGSLCLFILAAFLIFGFGNIWISMAHPLLAFFMCSYFLIPYRLVIENRRGWEIFQKHQILQQVEELKTNFISMMSHDLKTPIARIKGMTDVIERDHNPLSSGQREALDTIRSSSDDLLKFINAILEYGRIEAQQIQLNRQPKDLNALLNEVIKKYEFLAKVKHIQVLVELEPLFPLFVDSDLIRQIFSNLIENAIKYSPEDTKVLITSEESDGRVYIQVADQGPGIPADEVANIFMKFFRSKSAKSSTVKGSGLGLYLARYFTELHGGELSVETTYGQGCTFTVELPIHQGENHA